MENASKALSIAAGVLLGVMLLALIVYFFSSLGAAPQEKADAMSVEQLAAFNMEYEVYNKSMMYGVDVISCLNKAKDNNDKYLSEEKEKFGFLTEGKYPPEYVINVFVKLNKNYLDESVEVYYMNENNEEKLRDTNNTNNTKGDLVKSTFAKVFEKYNISYAQKNGLTEIGLSDKICTCFNKVKLDNNTPTDGIVEYSLLNIKDNGDISSKDTKLEKLLEFASNNMKIQIKNPNKNSEDLRDDWSSIIWKTALYDLKQKKFKISEDGIKYNKKTGRVSEIYFEEI